VDFAEQAQTASAMLIGATEEGARHLLKALVGEERANEDRELLAPLTCELLIFALHLTDRIAFARLGTRSRSGFMDALLTAVQRRLRPPIAEDLEQLYNTRNAFYGGFRNLYPEKNENLKGTLFWEFGKALGSVYADGNPGAITEISTFGMTFMQIIQEAIENAKVL